ncbi:MAG TPA: ATP synthase F1 subunit gamma [Candidatus Paceibacterota bacterium]|nr:ATP synthase F1 subunit gamma [Candidatus Paceibacterota bacterium]
MANLKSVKAKIISYKKTGTVTHAMEAVSAVKMRKSQERALNARSYAAAALSTLERLSGTADLAKHPLMQVREGKTALIIITSDKGLAGALNSGVIRAAERTLQERALDKSTVDVYAYGRRGGEYFRARGYTTSVSTNVSDDIPERDVMSLTQSIVSNPAYTSVIVAYQNFISTFEQAPTVRQIVPINAATLSEMVAGIRPVKGKYAPQHTEKDETPAAYTIEPDADSVLTVLLPRLLAIAVFHALLENKASEHSARMVAMKSATDKAKEMAQKLTRTFNKVRQASITREVSEITSGIEAMK